MLPDDPIGLRCAGDVIRPRTRDGVLCLLKIGNNEIEIRKCQSTLEDPTCPLFAAAVVAGDPAADRPASIMAADSTLLLATLFSMATTFCLYKLLRQFRSTRRTLNKFVRLSKQGPFYRGGAWLLGTLMRRTRGTSAIAAPG